MCGRVWIYERGSKLLTRRLWIFARFPSSGGICNCLRNQPARICILFLVPLSLICDQRKEAAQRGNDGGKWPQSLTASLNQPPVAAGTTKVGRNSQELCAAPFGEHSVFNSHQ